MTEQERKKFLKKTFTDTMATTTNRVINQDVYKELKKQEKKIDSLLRRINNHIGREEFEQHYHNLLKTNRGEKTKFDAKGEAKIRAFVNKKMNMGDEGSGKALLKDFKDAYKLVMQIRQTVMDEKITYSVVTEANNDEIETVELSTDQMLESLKLRRVRFNRISDNILSAIKTVQKKIKRTSYLRKERFSTQNNLYKSITSFYDTLASYTGQKKLNKGTRWQLYRYFYKKYNGNEDIVLTNTEQLLRGYFISKADYAWYLGGDVGNLQIKYKASSFASFNSVVTILEDLKKVLQESINMSETERTNAFRNLFQVSHKTQINDVVNKLDKFLEDKSIEELDKMFKKELQKSMA